MKKWFILLLACLCLTGCAKDNTPLDRPHSLAISYGSNEIFARTSGYQWVWREGWDTEAAIAEPTDPRSSLSKVTSLQAGTGTALYLNFSVEPDKLMVQDYSSADGYVTPTELEVVDMAVSAPLDGREHLLIVTAVWTESKDADNWGSCTYHFRFLTRSDDPSSSQMPGYSDLGFRQLVQLDASALLGVEFLNNADSTSKTCRTEADKAAILQYLQNNLTAEFRPASVAAPEANYMLRLVCVDGTQLSIGYGTDGLQSWILLGDTPYEAGTLDLAVLWNGLETGTLVQEAVTGRHYVTTAKTLPEKDWSAATAVYGYLNTLDSKTVTYDEMRLLNDNTNPSGYRLEGGWKDQSKDVSRDCQFWVYDETVDLYGRTTTLEEMLEWAAGDAETEPLFRLYLKNDEVVAIAEMIMP